MRVSLQIIRELVPPLARWVSSNRVTMSLLNNGTLIVIVWIQLCSAHERLFQQPFQDIVLIIVGAILLHFAFVAMNWPIVAYAGLPSVTCHITALINGQSATMPACLTGHSVPERASSCVQHIQSVEKDSYSPNMFRIGRVRSQGLDLTA